MSQSRERERQRWYLERFLEGADFGGTVGEARPTAPPGRFRLEGPEGGIGVRVAELLRPAPDPTVRESVRAFRDAVTGAAEREWSTDTERPHVEVWVEFSVHEQTTSSRDRDELARRLCRLVEDGLPPEGGAVRIVAGRGRDDASFPLVTPALAVARLPTYSGSTWHAVPSGPAPALDADAVRRAVRTASSGRRGEDASEERGGGTAGVGEGERERWLLGVVESFRGDPGPGIPDEVAEERYGSDFDRMWLLDPFGGEARELEVAARQAAG